MQNYRFLYALPLLLVALAAQSQDERPRQSLPLWPELPRVTPDREYTEDARVYAVDNPSMTPFWPSAERANGAAVVIFPGGGYRRLAWDKEGEDIARWFNNLGVAAFVVKYRMAEYGHPAPLLDGLRAVRYVRAHATEWRLKADRIGVMGFSAGGHLAGSVTLRHDFNAGMQEDDPWAAVSARPDFAMLIYPVVTMEGEAAHAGSRAALLGESPSADSLRSHSLQFQVNETVPPLFLVHGVGDSSVPVSNSLMLFDAVQKYSKSAELHVYQTDVHGFGMLPDQGTASSWPEACERWLRHNQFIQ